MEKDIGIRFSETPQLEKIEAWQQLDGSDFRIAFVPTQFSGIEGVAFILVKQEQGSDQFSVNIFEVPRETFIEWGGAARMLVIRGLLPNIEVFPENQRQSIAMGSMKEQSDFYEAATNKFFEMQMAGLVPMSQANLLNGMRELNYDLLFDNDIGTSVVD